MGLASAVAGKDDKSSDSPAAVVSIRASPVTVEDAGARLLAAIKASDVNAISDALRLAHHACEEEYGGKGSDDDDSTY